METESNIERLICAANYADKTDRLIDTLETVTKKAPDLSIKQLDLISSLYEQMAKLINDILEETNGNC